MFLQVFCVLSERYLPSDATNTLISKDIILQLKAALFSVSFLACLLLIFPSVVDSNTDRLFEVFNRKSSKKANHPKGRDAKPLT